MGGCYRRWDMGPDQNVDRGRIKDNSKPKLQIAYKGLRKT